MVRERECDWLAGERECDWLDGERERECDWLAGERERENVIGWLVCQVHSRTSTV